MDQMIEIVIYIVASSVIAMIDLYLAYKSDEHQKQTRGAEKLALLCIASAVVDLTYMVSALLENEMAASIASSLYFISMDLVLLSMISFCYTFTEIDNDRVVRFGRVALLLYGAFDALMLLINPFTNIVISYVPRDTAIAHFTYNGHILFQMHLIYAYIMAGVVFGMLISKLVRTPAQYRNQYTNIMAAIFIIIAFNAVFLYMPDLGIISQVDYSVLGYSVALFLIYWSVFHYSKSEMLKDISLHVFEKMDSAMMLFDYDGYLIMQNEEAKEYFGDLESAKRLKREEFHDICRLPRPDELNPDHYLRQCYATGGSADGGINCRYTRMADKKGVTTGHLYIFNSVDMERDSLTGFRTWNSFKKAVGEYIEINGYVSDTVIAVFDIDGLENINILEGHQSGDEKLAELARILKKVFPEDAFFVRGRDAYLIVGMNDSREADARICAEQVCEVFNGSAQYGLAQTTTRQQNLLEAVAEASLSMKHKKLLDKRSSHSQSITSLVRALEECDPDTEAHVKRTQIMGSELGRRMNLTDLEQSQLSLLCLLHDIGKIGVPLEILNKPGKLTDDEWKAIQAHVIKGYEIAMSSKDISDIAQMIRYHHERWDGKGYPEGLMRDRIPLLSRFIAVVDAYDAMVNDRSYRKARPKDEAIAELERCQGSQFDPQVVYEFKQVILEHPEFDEMFVSGNTIERSRIYGLFDEDSLGQGSTDMSHGLRFGKYLLDANNYMLEGNEGFEEITGYKVSEMVERRMNQLDLVPYEDQTEYMQLVAKMFEKYGTEVYVEHRLLRKNGDIINVLCHGRRYYDSSTKSERNEILILDVKDVAILGKSGGVKRPKD